MHLDLVEVKNIQDNCIRHDSFFIFISDSNILRKHESKAPSSPPVFESRISMTNIRLHRMKLVPLVSTNMAELARNGNFICFGIITKLASLLTFVNALSHDPDEQMDVLWHCICVMNPTNALGRFIL